MDERAETFRGVGDPAEEKTIFEPPDAEHEGEEPEGGRPLPIDEPIDLAREKDGEST